LVFRTVAGWLKEQTNHHFTIEELMSGQEFVFGGKKVRTYKADARDPSVYGILFSNPDSSIRGRQWITEIGVRSESNSVFCTVLLETSDISTRVTEIPATTKPKLIRYLNDNCQLAPETVGTTVINLKEDDQTLRAFLSELERPERRYPVVLVSHQFDGECIVSPRTLQGHLLGLAQVVVSDESMDSWVMERALGKRYSAWGGAINIIYPSRGRDFCRNKLYLIDELEDLKSSGVNVNLDILSRITHYSNGYKKRQHFSPHDVRAKRASDYRKFLKERFEKAQADGDQYELLEEAFQQIDEHDNIVESLKEKYQKEIEEEQQELLSVLEESENKDAQIWQLKAKISALEHAGESLAPSMLPVDIIDSVRAPTPEKCLQLLDNLFPDRIEVLDSGWRSARESETFKHTQKLADLLLRLATDYYDKISNGPDSEARKVFGPNEFSAQESETVKNNDELAGKRTYEYRGDQVSMFRHLKIGVADSVMDTIRVHYYWDNERGKIIIGYCGPHLPIASH